MLKISQFGMRLKWAWTVLVYLVASFNKMYLTFMYQRQKLMSYCLISQDLTLFDNTFVILLCFFSAKPRVSSSPSLTTHLGIIFYQFTTKNKFFRVHES